MITAKIGNYIDGYHVIVRDGERIRSLISQAFGDDYNVRRKFSQYEIRIKKNGVTTCYFDVDDYTCETWKKVQ